MLFAGSPQEATLCSKSWSGTGVTMGVFLFLNVWRKERVTFNMSVFPQVFNHYKELATFSYKMSCVAPVAL